MINTYNETKFHEILKLIYATQFNGKTEQKIDKFICDIVTENKEIIEIQTGNLTSLKEKIEFFEEKNQKIRIVHPLIKEKIINTFNKNGELLSTRKSPKQETIYSLPRKLTGIYGLLLNKNFLLEIIFVSIIEIRLKTENKTQNKTNTRRFLKNYTIQEKKLNKIENKLFFSSDKDFINLLPHSLPKVFTLPQLKFEVSKLPELKCCNSYSIKKSLTELNYLVWILEKMNLIKKTGKNGRSWNYTII